MSDYMQVLCSICFTMITGVVIVGCLGAMVFLSLMFWNMIQDNID